MTHDSGEWIPSGTCKGTHEYGGKHVGRWHGRAQTCGLRTSCPPGWPMEENPRVSTCTHSTSLYTVKKKKMHAHWLVFLRWSPAHPRCLGAVSVGRRGDGSAVSSDRVRPLVHRPTSSGVGWGEGRVHRQPVGGISSLLPHTEYVQFWTLPRSPSANNKERIICVD